MREFSGLVRIRLLDAVFCNDGNVYVIGFDVGGLLGWRYI